MLRQALVHWIRAVAKRSDDSLPASTVKVLLQQHGPLAEIFLERRSSLFEIWEKEPPGLPDGRTLTKVGVHRYAGLILDWHLEQGRRKALEDLLHVAEQLLLHVEVKRKASLRAAYSATAMEAWGEKLSIAIFFCHVAQKQNDLRFLNTALKINDWAYRFFRERMIPPQASIFIASLQEQESSMEGLLQ
jgi:hypothetical protein